MDAAYFDPRNESRVVVGLHTRRDLEELIHRTLQLRSARGVPTIEVERADSSSLSLAHDGERGFLVWIDSLGESYHSVGSVATDCALVFDYFGSYSEADPSQLIPLDKAIDSMLQFIEGGGATTESAIFSPD